MPCSDQTIIKIRRVAVAFLILISVIVTYISSTGHWRLLYLPVTTFYGTRAGNESKGPFHHQEVRPQRPVVRSQRPVIRPQRPVVGPQRPVLRPQRPDLRSKLSASENEHLTLFSSSEATTAKSAVTITAKHKITVQDNRREMTSSFEDLVERRKNFRNITNVTGTDTLTFDIQQKRIRQVLEVCHDEQLISNISSTKYRPRYYYSKSYNFSYCKVPKVGSTFWTQAFQILDNDNKGEDVFKLTRELVHVQSIKRVVRFMGKSRKRSETVLVSRDPYSRLYSAFIDKSFLFMHASTNLEIRKMFPKVNNTRNYCPTEITFQEFLDFIIAKAKKGKKLDKHWAPIVNLCRPCDVNAQVLVKQESFSTDVEYALRAFGVDDEKLDMILPALHSHRIEDSVPGIIDTLYDKIPESCMDRNSFTKRVWKSFQIQGFLKNELSYPDKEFEGIWIESETVKGVVMDYINSHPMTSQERKSQRNKALLDAYKGIKEETFTGIKNLYEVDFKMFGYDMNPPQI